MADNRPNRLLAMDGLKLIAAYFVVTIHTGFSGSIDGYVRAVSEYAVPFFFMCSGYFLYGREPEKIRRRLIHTLKLLLGASVLYGLYQCAAIAVLQEPRAALDYIVGLMQPSRLARALLFNDTAASHLWYLSALAYVYGIHYLLSTGKASDRFLILSVAVLLAVRIAAWQVLLAVLPEPGEQVWLVRNFLLEGYPMVGIGMIVRKYRSAIPKVTPLRLAALLAAGVAAAVYTGAVLGHQLITVGAFVIALSQLLFSLDARPVRGAAFLENAGSYSTFVYIFHPLLISALSILLLAAGIPMEDAWMVNSFPFVICLLTTAGAVLCRRLQLLAGSGMDRRKKKTEAVS